MPTEAVADAIRERRTQGLPCAAPVCAHRATYAFLFTRLCRVGGRWRQPGDWLDVCDEHARQVYRAQDADSYAQMPAWLRPDPTAAPSGDRPAPGRFLGVL